MPDDNAEGWRGNWARHNLQEPGYCSDKREMGVYAAVCRADALNAGISGQGLVAAAGGDLEGYLRDAQNRFTEDDAERKD